MKAMTTIAVALILFATPVCRAGDRAANTTEKTMNVITIPETTQWNTGEFRVAVAYIVVGKYLDARGREQEGPKASLEIVKKGSRPGENIKSVDVGAGSTFKLGDRTYSVQEVVDDEDGNGLVRVVETSHGSP